jgi:hypothetical protein
MLCILFFLLCRHVGRNSTEGKRGRGQNLPTFSQNQLIFFFFIFGFVSFRLVSFRFSWFRFVSFCFVLIGSVSIGSVSFRSVPFRYVSFWFRFALYRDPEISGRSRKFFCETGTTPQDQLTSVAEVAYTDFISLFQPQVCPGVHVCPIYRICISDGFSRLITGRYFTLSSCFLLSNFSLNRTTHPSISAVLKDK